jgi:hypothetical protein
MPDASGGLVRRRLSLAALSPMHNVVSIRASTNQAQVRYFHGFEQPPSEVDVQAAPRFQGQS